MKILGLNFGPERCSESDLKSAIDSVDAKLGTETTFTYSRDTVGEVNVDDLAAGSRLGIPEIPLHGFEPREVLGGTKLDK